MNANTIQRRPAVHQLCTGAFLQERIWIDETVLAVPLRPLGFTAQAQYAALYVRDIGGTVHADGVAGFAQQADKALPVVAIISFHRIDARPTELEAVATPLLDRARQVITWMSGNDVVPFAMVTATDDNTYFRPLAPATRRRTRLGFGNTGRDFYAQVRRITRAADEDERYALALTLHHDAVRERNARFRIARLFNCLECLAYRITGKHDGITIGSRRAVKYLLRLKNGVTVRATIDGREYAYDHIEVAGRIRDKLFHGAPFRRSDLIEEAQPAFDLFEERPEEIARPLMGAVELELARWANGASNGLQPYDPARDPNYDPETDGLAES